MHFKMSNGRRPNGMTLMEVIAASALTALVLVPSMKILSKADDSTRRIERALSLQNAACTALQNALLSLNTSFESTVVTKSLSEFGEPRFRMTLEMSDLEEDGGAPDALMVVHVLAWDDIDGDLQRDANEQTVELWTKASALATIGSTQPADDPGDPEEPGGPSWPWWPWWKDRLERFDRFDRFDRGLGGGRSDVPWGLLRNGRGR